MARPKKAPPPAPTKKGTRPGYRKRVETKEGIEFKITPADGAAAVCGNPTECVVARAVKRVFGPLFEEIHVGSRTTKIVTPTVVLVFRTQPVLSAALRTFDKTGRWPLAPGTYALLAARRSKPRWHLKGKGPKPGVKPQDRFEPIGKGRASRTRVVKRVDTLCVV